MTSNARQQQTYGAERTGTPRPRTPAVIAIERVAKLAVAGTSVHKMVAVACGIVSGWRAEAMQSDVLAEQVEVLRSDVDSGVWAAEDYVDEADEKDKPKALIQLEALRAVQHAPKTKLERFA